MADITSRLTESHKHNLRSMISILRETQYSFVKDSICWHELGKAQALGVEILQDLDSGGFKRR